METILNNISTPGIVILGVQSTVFLSIVFLEFTKYKLLSCSGVF